MASIQINYKSCKEAEKCNLWLRKIKTVNRDRPRHADIMELVNKDYKIVL